MYRVLLGIIFLCGLSELVKAQEEIRLYFVQKINISPADKNKLNQLPNATYAGAMVSIYQLTAGVKTDSVLVEAEDFQRWKDTVAFSAAVPASFITNAPGLSASPLLHIVYSKPGRGDFSLDIKGKEKPVSQIQLKIKSDPSGANVFLVPKIVWDRNPLFKRFDQSLLAHYNVYNGLTTVKVPVQEFVYVVVYSYNNHFKTIECRPSHLNPVDSVYLKLN
ncbi:hypothetical protein [Mucilaginibacter paludis]|uniref:Uncharacterized protein n=1 Tax=Mucilaginibacter paludis DSM 18603 TaxID=714943 RepID=H1YAF1_9SPHI|nr:hypothetical protein [Mucilaginibacter paludis]EHQ26994.1 hypothetical protein Mucpa_2885 [Mucilaginibacter paludis DSM 18603]